MDCPSRDHLVSFDLQPQLATTRLCSCHYCCQYPSETVAPVGCVISGCQGKLTIRQINELEKKLCALSDWIDVMHTSTNPIFLLWVIVDLFTKDTAEVERRRQSVLMKLQLEQRRSILGGKLHHIERNFTELTAQDVAAVLDAIDGEFFQGAIAAVFRYHRRLLEFRTVADDVLPTQAGSFSRSGIQHFLSVSSAMLLRAFPDANTKATVCGYVCSDRLDALVRVVEHELCHLIVYTNWSVCDEPHGSEFIAVSRGFFRHQSSTHGLPVLPEHIEKYRQAAIIAFRNNRAFVPPVYAGLQVSTLAATTSTTTSTTTAVMPLNSTSSMLDDDPEAGIPTGPCSSVFVAYDFPNSAQAILDGREKVRRRIREDTNNQQQTDCKEPAPWNPADDFRWLQDPNAPMLVFDEPAFSTPSCFDTPPEASFPFLSTTTFDDYLLRISFGVGGVDTANDEMVLWSLYQEEELLLHDQQQRQQRGTGIKRRPDYL